MRVHWTHRATARLRAIQEYVAEANPSAAHKEVEKILRRSQRLAEPPDIGHPVPGYEDASLREVLVRPYRLVYRVTPQQIDITTVLHYQLLLPGDLDVPRPDSI